MHVGVLVYPLPGSFIVTYDTAPEAPMTTVPVAVTPPAVIGAVNVIVGTSLYLVPADVTSTLNTASVPGLISNVISASVFVVSASRSASRPKYVNSVVPFATAPEV